MKTERRVKLGKALIFVVLFAAFLSVGCASAATYTVCPSGCNYSSIQAAIEAADPGDTIEVHSGTYYENVDVTKQLILRGVGTGTGKPVVDADDSGSAITLSADGITLEGFTVTNSGGSHLEDDAGIKVTSNSNNNNITGNTVINSKDGIFLYSSESNNIIDNNVRDNSNEGIHLFSSSNNNNITGNTVINSNYGISLWSSSNNNIITNNNVSNNDYYGLYLSSSESNNIIGNTVRDNDHYGIDLFSSSNNNNITGNTVINSNYGIHLWSSSNNNIITNNTVRDNNADGISLSSSESNNIIDNNVRDNSHDGIYLGSSESNNIIGNTVSNSNYGISLSSSESNNIIDNNVRDNDYYGIDLVSSKSNNIIGNTVCDNNANGIYLWSSSNNNIITNNNVSNSNYGIYLSSSESNNIIGNNVSNNGYNGIHLFSSCNNNIITNNTVSNNADGIYLFSSESNNIIDNTVRDNSHDGIFLYSSESNNIIGNNVRDNSNEGIHLFSSSNNNIITNNTVSNNADGIYLFSSESNNIIDNTVRDNSHDGIYLFSSESNNIIDNNVRDNNADGIYLSYSSNNLITNNTVRDNSKDGIYLFSSESNKFYLNNFINNTDNAYSEDSTNIWNSTGEMTYTYNGSTYTNYLGNYWSDYVFAGNDTNNDGIGDTPYSIDGNIDTYPLIEQWENYFAPSEKQPTIILFSPSSPVSDIEGATRTFSITIDQTVNVSWFINGTVVQKNTSVTSASYTNKSAANGTWNVSAIVTNVNGLDMRVWVWNVTLKENQPPVANFTYSPVNPIVAQPMTFDASNSKDPDGNITNYEWTFGDGNLTNTTEQISTYSYASACTFTVTLTVTDDEGATNATSQAITVSEGLVFDTGTGKYPSISGTHNGTITPIQTITVQKLYTYPCTGTGGHTEYAKICDESWSVETRSWAGYNGDWHNISFNESFQLYANVEYNYTVITSSYPQVHHTNALLTTNGWINCTGFVDVNGKFYKDRIPAIKIE